MNVYLYDLPCKCRGFILRDPHTDEESIVLNSKLTNETNKATYIHEMTHKLLGDLDSCEDVNSIERRAHDSQL